jgi:hypothetical protein
MSGLHDSKHKIFDLLRIYHESRENIRLLVELSTMADYEKIGFIDAWQEEMADFFRQNGYCFACNRALARCDCVEPLHPRTSHLTA